MSGTGPFDTSTKTKIKTPYGTILKVSRYEVGFGRPETEYKIHGKCSYCGADMGCWCFEEDNCDDPIQEATDCLRGGFVCESPTCVIACKMNDDPDFVAELRDKYSDDEDSIMDEIMESWGELDGGPSECGV